MLLYYYEFLKMDITKTTPKDLFVEGVNFILFKNDILIVKIDDSVLHRLNYDIFPICVNGYGAYLVQKGSLEITIDWRKYMIGQHGILELYNYNIINIVRFSPDFEGYFILISDVLYDSIENLTNLKPLNKISLNYIGLANTVDEHESQNLLKLLQRVYNSIFKYRYDYQTNIVYAEVMIFLLEFGFLRVEKNGLKNETSSKDLDNSYKYIILQFSRLVILYCRQENSISFYASKLFLTSQYLSHIVKEYSGMSAKSWINKARISEAKNLLWNTKYAIQQISEELNFSNLTSFCRFFRKHTKMSPLEYRKKILTS